MSGFETLSLTKALIRTENAGLFPVDHSENQPPKTITQVESEKRLFTGALFP